MRCKPPNSRNTCIFSPTSINDGFIHYALARLTTPIPIPVYTSSLRTCEGKAPSTSLPAQPAPVRASFRAESGDVEARTGAPGGISLASPRRSSRPGSSRSLRRQSIRPSLWVLMCSSPNHSFRAARDAVVCICEWHSKRDGCELHVRQARICVRFRITCGSPHEDSGWQARPVCVRCGASCAT